jgi:peptidoglycan/LPS O-acetylase OafA/YrhL
VLFLKHDKGDDLSITADFFNESRTPLINYLLIPQAWSLGVELSFYLLAPLLARVRSSVLLLLLFASVCFRLWFYESMGLFHEPWVYKFLPFELAVFICGMLGFRSGERLRSVFARFNPSSTSFLRSSLMVWGFVALAVIADLRFGLWVQEHVSLRYALMVEWIIWPPLIWVLFELSKKGRVDRWLGELSYPLYLTHLITIQFVTLLLKRYSVSSSYIGPASAVSGIILAVVFYMVVLRAVDKKRDHFSIVLSDHLRRLVRLNRY